MKISQFTLSLAAAVLCLPSALSAQTEATQVVKLLKQNITRAGTLEKEITAGKETLIGVNALSKVEQGIKAGVTSGYLNNLKIAKGFDRSPGLVYPPVKAPSVREGGLLLKINYYGAEAADKSLYFIYKGMVTDHEESQKLYHLLQSARPAFSKFIPHAKLKSILDTHNPILKTELRDDASGAVRRGYLFFLQDERVFVDDKAQTLTHYFIDKKTGKATITNKIALIHSGDTHSKMRSMIPAVAGMRGQLGAAGVPSVALDVGDFLDTSWAKAVIQMMNKGEIQFITLGNHDMGDWLRFKLEGFLSAFEGKILIFNITRGGKPLDYSVPYERVKINGVNYVFAGAAKLGKLREAMVEENLSKSFDENVLPYLRPDDNLVLLMHSSAVKEGAKPGNFDIEEFARHITQDDGIDPARIKILGGHEHNTVTDLKIFDIAYSEPGAMGAQFNIITTYHHPFSGKPTGVDVASMQTENAVIDAEVQKFAEQFSPGVSKIAGRTESGLTGREGPYAGEDGAAKLDRLLTVKGEAPMDSDLGFIMASLEYKYFIESYPPFDLLTTKIIDKYKAEGKLFVHFNTPSAKNPLPAGEITSEDVRLVRPCIPGSGGEETLALVLMKGADIKKYITYGLQADKALQVSPQIRVRYRYDFKLKNKEGKTVGGPVDVRFTNLTSREMLANPVYKYIPPLSGNTIDDDAEYLMLTSTNNVGDNVYGYPGKENENDILNDLTHLVVYIDRDRKLMNFLPAYLRELNGTPVKKPSQNLIIRER